MNRDSLHYAVQRGLLLATAFGALVVIVYGAYQPLVTAIAVDLAYFFWVVVDSTWRWRRRVR